VEEELGAANERVTLAESKPVADQPIGDNTYRNRKLSVRGNKTGFICVTQLGLSVCENDTVSVRGLQQCQPVKELQCLSVRTRQCLPVVTNLCLSVCL
jgi:hypothetical protein